MREQGLRIKTVTITAKEKLCALEEMDCRPDSCPYAKGHFDRVNDAVFDMITSEERIEREILLDYADKHQVCPFEMCLDASEWVDGVICDYNYAFDPNVHLKRFLGKMCGAVICSSLTRRTIWWSGAGKCIAHLSIKRTF